MGLMPSLARSRLMFKPWRTVDGQSLDPHSTQQAFRGEYPFDERLKLGAMRVEALSIDSAPRFEPLRTSRERAKLGINPIANGKQPVIGED